MALTFLRTARVLRGALIAACACAPAALVLSSPPAAAQSARIFKVGDAGQSERLTLGLGKAAIIQLPRAARDVLIADPNVADITVQSDTRSFIIGRAIGATSAFFLDGHGRQILSIDVRVEPDLGDLRDMLARHFPEAPVAVEAANEHIVLSGEVATAAVANAIVDMAARYLVGKDGASGARDARVMNMMTVAGEDQVMIRVRIAEMNRNAGKALGINWATGFRVAGFAAGVGVVNGFGVSGTPTTGVIPTVAGGVTGAASNFGLRTNDISAESLLRALERNGLLRVLAEPTLTAISGETASFLAGGEFPIVASVDEDTVSVEFKDFGVALNFTPVVLSKNRINLEIATEVSELSSEGAVTLRDIAVPALSVRRASTTIELPSGGSMVLAGLLSEDTRHAIEGVPGIKEVPVLGGLFRSRDYVSSQTELVVMATPYIVRPVDEADIRLPTDGFAPAADGEAVLLGRLQASYGGGNDARAAPAPAPAGAVGFIVE